MNRYLAKLTSLDEKRAYPSNPQNPQNPTKRGFEGFEGSPSSAFLQSATPPTELRADTEQARHDRFEQRAAIADAGPYADALAALRAKCPAYIPEDRWQQAITDATTFITNWGAEAQACGWAARELFGLHPVPEQPAAFYDRLARVDDLGLVWLLRGRPVIVLTSTEAVMRCQSGATLTYRRHNKPTPEIVDAPRIAAPKPVDGLPTTATNRSPLEATP